MRCYAGISNARVYFYFRLALQALLITKNNLTVTINPKQMATVSFETHSVELSDLQLQRRHPLRKLTNLRLQCSVVNLQHLLVGSAPVKFLGEVCHARAICRRSINSNAANHVQRAFDHNCTVIARINRQPVILQRQRPPGTSDSSTTVCWPAVPAGRDSGCCLGSVCCGRG